METVFTIPVAARGQGRPRFGRNGAVYKGEADRRYEEVIAAHYLEIAGKAAEYRGPVSLTVNASYRKPKSWSKKKAAEVLFKLTVPDTSNIVKGIEDALNRIAYHDDAQIVELHAWKGWGERDEVIVTVKRLWKE